jgi:hypothetical protein
VNPLRALTRLQRFEDLLAAKVSADSKRVLRRELVWDALPMILGALGWLALVAKGIWVVYPTDALLLLAAYGVSGAAYAAITDAVFVKRCRANGAFFFDLTYTAFTVALSIAFLLVVRYYPALIIRSTTEDGFNLIYAIFCLFVFGLSVGGLASHVAFERLWHVRRYSRRIVHPATGRRSVEFRIVQAPR